MTAGAGRRLAAGAALVAASLAVLACNVTAHRNDSKGLAPRGSGRPWSVQMHLHALSNHNASPNPASMQWHTAFAKKTGTEILWWSEHAEIFSLADPFRLRAGEGTLEGQALRFPGSDDRARRGGRKRRVDRIAWEASGDGTEAILRDGYLFGRARAASDGSPSRMTFEPRTASGAIRTVAFCRPVTFGAMVSAEVDLGPRDASRRASFRFPLSWHDYGAPVRYEVVFRLAPAGAAPETTLADSGTVVVTMPCPDGRSTLRFDLLPAARRLRDGDDATLTGVEWEVEGTGPGDAVLGVRSIEVWNASHSAEANVDAARLIARRYEAEYGVVEKTGAEYRWQATHLNAFYPDDVTPGDALATGARPFVASEVSAWVGTVHARGGVVSLNHPFGTSFGPGDEGEEGDDDSVGTGRLLDLAAGLIAERAYGCDVMEVGYVRRGGSTLAQHLELWDLLTANRCWVYGNGTSDSHGGPWYGEHNPNWFVTWIWSPDTNPASLVAAVRKGRLFFGDRSRWNGTFDFQLDGDAAGSRVAFSPRVAKLSVVLDPLPPDASVRLVQGALGDDPERVAYVERGKPVDPADPGTVRIDAPCFVRLEVWSRSGGGEEVPVLFSNPIVYF